MSTDSESNDVIVIGTGQAGVPLAVRLANAGRSVLLVERALLGGTCTNYGCTPTKTMVASARAAHVARNAARLGVRASSVEVDLAAVVKRKDEVVKQWRAGAEKRIAGAGERLTFVKGHARFTAAHEIEVEGEPYRAPVIVINTGARPARPSLPGLDSVPWLDSTRILELTELPEHLVVLGGGYVGCEFAQMFRRFGARVTIVQRAAHVLDREDVDVSEAIEAVFLDEGIDLLVDAAVTGVVRQQRGVALTFEDGRTLEGSHLLVAVGRTPNTEDLGTEAAGIRLNDRGFIEVDDAYRTSADGVYAVGDVAGGPQFTHTAWDDHRILFEILENDRTGGRGGRLVPYCVFTDPQVARVGLSQREAERDGAVHEVATMPFGHVARAIEVDETAGLIRVLIDPHTERILGAAIVGIEAGELIHVFAALMQADAPARALVDVQVVHPTLAEGLQSALMSLDRYRLR